MEQYHLQHKQLSNTTAPTPTHPQLHLPTQLELHNDNIQLSLEGDVDDKKNGVIHLPPTHYTSQTLNNNNASDVNLKPPKLTRYGGDGVRYGECLKNHGASIGINVVDGCGEFMPGGKDGTFEALKCAACHCHRNFHRHDHDYFPTSAFFPIKSAHPSFHHQIVHPMTAVAYGSGGATESSSEDLVQVLDEMPQRDYDHHHNPVPGAATNNNNRKRFRTKFTQEQKEEMKQFAVKINWRLQRQDDEMVEKFCSEIGIRRQVLKVWMHNNKTTFKKHPPLFVTPASDHEDPPPPPPQPQPPLPHLHRHHL